MSSLRSFLEKEKAKYIESDIYNIHSVIQEKELREEFFLSDDVCFAMAASSAMISIVLALFLPFLMPIDFDNKIIRGAAFFGVLITTVIGLIAFHSPLCNFIFKINKNSRVMHRCKEKIFNEKIITIEAIEEMTQYCDENMFKKFLIFADKEPTYAKLEAFVSKYEREFEMIEHNEKIDNLTASLYKNNKKLT